tara:strand:+ start:979 stop:1206 length:228 start_codon:yes stop_codon:yes gene_type:complete
MTEILGLCGIVCCIVAIWLQWNLQHRFSHLEDRYKDGRIDSAQMRRGLHWARLAPIIFTLMGATLMLGAASQLIG